MKKPLHIAYVWIFLIAIEALFSPILLAAYTPKTVSKLVADIDPSNPYSTGRIPLILIHGVHGTDLATFNSIDGSSASEKAYFANLLAYFYSSNLKDKYQIYRFHYLSDELSVQDIGKGLQEWLDDFIQKGKIKDVPFVILAHSMGGLVARSYMQEHQHAVGVYAGQFGGQRVLKLITIATPHHGSPGANSQSRDDLALDLEWLSIIKISSFGFWKKDDVIGIPIDTVAHDQPSRSDLRWDNFDNAMNNANPDMNIWLQGLNGNISYDNRIIAYYGYIDPSESYRSYLSDPVLGPSRILAGIDIIIGDNHTSLIAASAIMDAGLSYNYPFNDGLVVDSSGRFVGHSVNLRHGPIDDGLFFGYDHIHMKDGLVEDGSIPLFETLANDLNTAYTSATLSTIAIAEYFIDTDPGIGYGISILTDATGGPLDMPMENIVINDIDTSNLTVGIHNLYIRMKNSNGLWGTPRKIMFEVTGVKYIADAEYYIDTDPGPGNGLSILPFDGAFDQKTERISPAINTTPYNLGMHTLYVRMKDSEGHWGTPRGYRFEVRQPLYITKAEFFVDSDPGDGNGIPMVPADGQFHSTVEDMLGFVNTSGLCMGNHTVSVRALDSYSRWGVPGSTNARILSASPGPIAIYVDDDNSFGTECGTPAQPFDTIQEGLEVARNGDTIQVLGGIYGEPVVIGQDNVSLLGEGALLTFIDPVISGSCIEIDGRHNVDVEGFTLQNCTADIGAGIHINDSFDITIAANALFANEANFFGGGIAITGNSSSVSIKNNVMSNNSSLNAASGIYLNTTGNNIRLVNNTLVDNSSATGGIHVQKGVPEIRNSILWGNNPLDLFGVSNSMITYSLIGDCTYEGIGYNICGDPLFVLNDPYYHLVSCSPAVDAGDPADDYSQEPVPNGARINMGAYGNTPEAEKPPNPTDTDGDTIVDACDNCTLVKNTNQRDTNKDRYGNMCDPDLDNNGAVGISDFGLFKAAFGTSNADADFDGNGAVGVSDFGIFKSYFGKPPGPSGLVP